MKESIMHDGVIESVDGNAVSVKIVQMSSCAECQARSLCRISEMKEKIVEVFVSDPERYSVGQRVFVSATTQQGLRAVLLSFGVPVLLLLSVLFLCTSFGVDEGYAALFSLLSVVPYYLALLLFRKRLRSYFHFSIDVI